ncbi:MAG: agmatinase [Candidatus Doudnabacteria bacterium]|nr:agmatinase [Candidatus Doudnabacteria bacterium]
MRPQTQKNGFLGADEGQSFQTPYRQARTVIIPFGFEATVSYGGGTKRGPQAIINASYQVETFDEQTFTSPYKTGIATLAETAIPKKIPRALKKLGRLVGQVLADKKFPVVLGGEHTLSFAVAQALSKKFANLSVVHFDAHSDMRKSYEGNPYSHASVMYRVLKFLPVKRIVQIGIRNLSDLDGELDFRDKQRARIKTFWAWEKLSPQGIAEAIPTKNVFISFDVDVFDPSIMPSTGTPEPGGLTWWQTLKILKRIFMKKNVVGADIVELAPIKGLHAPDFLVAKLAHKIIGFKFAKN